MIRARTLFTVICSGLAWQSASATELTFRFNNPQFGGNPLNSNYLMGQASEQNNFKAPTTTVITQPKTQLETFKDNLQRAILNRLSSSATQNLFDDQGNLKLGTDLNFDLNNDGQSDFAVKVDSTATTGNVGITITDGISTTTLVVPTANSAATATTSTTSPTTTSTIIPAAAASTVITPVTSTNTTVIPVSTP